MNPKASFLKSALREPLEKWVVTKEAEAARDCALLEFIAQQPTSGNVTESWDQHSQLVGARKILEILFELPFPEKETRLDRLPNLRPPK